MQQEEHCSVSKAISTRAEMHQDLASSTDVELPPDRGIPIAANSSNVPGIRQLIGFRPTGWCLQGLPAYFDCMPCSAVAVAVATPQDMSSRSLHKEAEASENKTIVPRAEPEIQSSVRTKELELWYEDMVTDVGH